MKPVSLTSGDIGVSAASAICNSGMLEPEVRSPDVATADCIKLPGTSIFFKFENQNRNVRQ